MSTKVTSKNRERRIDEKNGILVEEMARKLACDCRKGDINPKEIDSYVKLLDRYKGNTPAKLPKVDITDDIQEEEELNIPDMPDEEI